MFGIFEHIVRFESLKLNSTNAGYSLLKIHYNPAELDQILRGQPLRRLLPLLSCWGKENIGCSCRTTRRLQKETESRMCTYTLLDNSSQCLQSRLKRLN
ncbi:hypothetical protein C0J52_19466 [Blattella germanica]|nr:hypothetical protein C0J52_19466 [Blattella germanica]